MASFQREIENKVVVVVAVVDVEGVGVAMGGEEDNGGSGEEGEKWREECPSFRLVWGFLENKISPSGPKLF